MQITKWLVNGIRGDLSDNATTEELNKHAGRVLDKHCSGEIIGDCLFIGENGKFYSGSVEFVIFEVSPAEAKEIQERQES